MTNSEVKQRFLQGQRAPARATTLVSRDGSLFSYDWIEIARWHRNRIVVRNGVNYSHTTTMHKRGLGGVLAVERTPRDQGPMNL